MFRASVACRGVSGLHSFLKTAYSDCIVKRRSALVGPRPDYVFVDVNNFLYSYDGFPFAEFVRGIYRVLRNILRTTGAPTHTLFFGIDGPGPHAKIPVQVRRRLSTNLKQRASSSHLPLLDRPINPLEFTPGTIFLLFLKAVLTLYIFKLTLSSFFF